MFAEEEPIESIYFNWLHAKINRVRVPTPSLTHWKLLLELQKTEFAWFVPLDDNRAEDGKELRREFLRTNRIQIFSDWMDVPCSVLEMLVAFSRRASFLTDRSPRDWFWEMLDNLELTQFTDADFDLFKVNDILYCFVWRTYDYNGRGGLFPLQHPRHDQRKVEILDQFSEYLDERGFI